MRDILVDAMYPDLGYNRFKEGLGGKELPRRVSLRQTHQTA